ncbi:MAG: ABC transporter ATP-binding protein [Bacteroidales bacterium]|nr:ABC transporter ATP-binding protein [Bacteroidales bacterium]
MNDLLQIAHFSCGYASDFKIEVDDITIKKGDFCGIIGPNGAGKTTLFRGITGELPVLEGSISFEGNDLSKMKRQRRAQKMAIVNQNVGSPHIPVEEYVLLGRIPFRKSLSFVESKEDYEIAHRFMRMTDTYRFKDKMMSELSGGEQQLAAIARALAQEPELLLLDEPTSHLDISHAVSILNLLQRLNQEEKLTIMMVIHDLNLAGEYCEQLIMMKEGRVFATGTPEEVMTYQNIEAVHDTVVITQKNPLSGKPAVFIVSQKVMDQNK